MLLKEARPDLSSGGLFDGRQFNTVYRVDRATAEAVDQQCLIAFLQIRIKIAFLGQSIGEASAAHHPWQAAAAHWRCQPCSVAMHQQVGHRSAAELSIGVAQ